MADINVTVEVPKPDFSAEASKTVILAALTAITAGAVALGFERLSGWMKRKQQEKEAIVEQATA